MQKSKAEIEELIEKTEEQRLRASGDYRYLAGIQATLKRKREMMTWEIESNERQLARLNEKVFALNQQIKQLTEMIGEADGA